MAKRKRGEAGGEYGGTPEEWQQQQGQQYGAGGVEYASSSATTGTGGAPPENAAASALTESAETGHQWNNSSSVYPEVPSYAQQPYFFQQTDPSTYNSPWPPPEATAFGSQTSNYSVSAPATTMPYFPTQPAVTEPSDSTMETAVALPQPASYQNYPSEIEAPSQYAYAQQPGASSQARGDQSSAFLYEDASMHLKIQSLPILENLVRETRPTDLKHMCSVLTSTGHAAHPHNSQSKLPADPRDHASQRYGRQPSVHNTQEPFRPNAKSV